jgi:hypothetical protein
LEAPPESCPRIRIVPERQALPQVCLGSNASPRDRWLMSDCGTTSEVKGIRSYRRPHASKRILRLVNAPKNWSYIFLTYVSARARPPACPCSPLGKIRG